MTEIRSTNASLPLAVLFLVTFLCIAAGCKPAHHGSEASPATSGSVVGGAVEDPVIQAHARGRQWALNNKFTLISDCGALDDPDERFGCADYVNNLPH